MSNVPLSAGEQKDTQLDIQVNCNDMLFTTICCLMYSIWKISILQVLFRLLHLGNQFFFLIKMWPVLELSKMLLIKKDLRWDGMKKSAWLHIFNFLFWHLQVNNRSKTTGTLDT